MSNVIEFPQGKSVWSKLSPQIELYAQENGLSIDAAIEFTEQFKSIYDLYHPAIELDVPTAHAKPINKALIEFKNKLTKHLDSLILERLNLELELYHLRKKP